MNIIELCAFCNLLVLSYLHVRRVCRRPCVGNLQKQGAMKGGEEIKSRVVRICIHPSTIIYIGICHFAVHVTTTYCSQFIKYIYKMYYRSLVVA